MADLRTTKGMMNASCRAPCQKAGLVSSDESLKKINRLYDGIIVIHQFTSYKDASRSRWSSRRTVNAFRYRHTTNSIHSLQYFLRAALSSMFFSRLILGGLCILPAAFTLPHDTAHQPEMNTLSNYYTLPSTSLMTTSSMPSR